MAIFRREFLLADTEQDFIAIATPDDIAPAIRHPSDGMLVALDPDIRATHQRLRFVAQGMKAVPHARWLLDGKPLLHAAGKRTSELSCNWLPWPGRHTLTLVAGGNAVLD